MPKPIYQHPGDDLAKLYTPVLETGTLATGYSLDWLSNDNPAMCVRFVESTIRLVWDLGSAQLVALPILLHGNQRSTDTVTFETNTSNSWPGAVVTAWPMTDADGAGYRPFPFLDRTGGTAHRWVSVQIVSAVPVVLGGVWLGAVVRSLVHNVQWGVRMPRGIVSVVHRTNANVRHGFARDRTIGMENGIIETTNAGAAAIQTWGDAASWRLRPVPFIPDPAVNDAWLVNFAQDRLDAEPTSASNIRLALALEHVALGEAWG